MAASRGRRPIWPTSSSRILRELNDNLAPTGSASALHGRRKGKKLRTYQAGLVEDLLPKLKIDVSAIPADIEALFGARPAQVCLEIGFGGGEHLAFQAERHPQTGFLGCEPFVNGAAKLLAAIDERSLANIRLHVGDAGELIDQLPAASLSLVYLLYPDPWPKRRQRKRRFVSDKMLVRLARTMQPGAELRFATDIDDYAGWVLARVLRSKDFAWMPADCADWLSPWPAWPGTRYEAKAMLQDRPRSYLTFRRR